MLEGILGNKVVIGSMLKTLRNHMLKEGVTAIVLLRSDHSEGETTGIDIREYKTKVGIVDGQEDADFVARCFEMREHILRFAPDREAFESFDFDMYADVIYGPAMGPFTGEMPAEKGVEDGL